MAIAYTLDEQWEQVFQNCEKLRKQAGLNPMQGSHERVRQAEMIRCECLDYYIHWMRSIPYLDATMSLDSMEKRKEYLQKVAKVFFNETDAEVWISHDRGMGLFNLWRDVAKKINTKTK